MSIDITNLSAVSRLIGEIESSENDMRKRHEYGSYKIYSGEQALFVEKELQTLFPKSWDSMRVSNVNVLKKVVNKIARAYKKPPTRIVEGNEKGTESLNQIYNDNTFNQSFKSLDVGYNRHKYQLSWVVNDPNFKTEFKLRALNPYLFDLVINRETNELEVVVLSYPDEDITREVSNSDGINQTIAESQDDAGSVTKSYSIWTKDAHVTVGAKKTKVGNEIHVSNVYYEVDESNPSMSNPLGILPFVFVTTDFDIPDYPIRSSLPDESININILNSDLLTASALQGFGQLILKYPKGSKIDLLHSGFTTYLELPQENDPDAPETTADYINANPDLAGMRNVVYDYASSVMADHGLDGISLDGSEKNFTSGFDRMLAMADVTETREDNIETYSQAEKKIFDIIKAYDRVNGTNMFNENDTLTVIFPKPEVLQSESERLAIIKQKMELGLIEEYEKFMIDNPHLSADEAMEKAERIKEEKAQRVAEMQAMMPQMDQGNDGRDDERDQSE